MSRPDEPGRGRTRGRHAVGRTLRRQLDRTLLGFINGLDWATRDPSRLVDQTPYEVVFNQDLLTLRHYPAPAREEPWELGTEMMAAVQVQRHPVPVLLIPPLMVKPFIYDLSPNRSYVRTLQARGYDVYLVDFGEPRRSDQWVRLDDYVLSWIPETIDQLCGHSGQDQVTLLGYCMGGMFALMHTSANQDERVRNIITIGSPVDSHKMGLLAWLVRVSQTQIDFVSKQLGNIPGDLSSAAFKMTAPLKSFTRYADLFINLWNEEYVNDFDALRQWTDNFIDYPGEAFRQLVDDFLVGNKLKDGRWTFGQRVADLSRITCPVLAFAGKDDQIVPASAVRRVVELVSSEDTEVRVVPGGHMGMFGGRRAVAAVMEASAEWLAERSGVEPEA